MGAHGSDAQTGGQSVADLLARLQVQPSGAGGVAAAAADRLQF
ncbi:hypothetical protein I547_7528 [Mycobacterium kansasii 824]|nr:hypothetical protein I547_7528 [Mycobacterium kansasii 824]